MLFYVLQFDVLNETDHRSYFHRATFKNVATYFDEIVK